MSRGIYNTVRWEIVRLECLFYEASETIYRALSGRHGRNSKIFDSCQFASAVARTSQNHQRTRWLGETTTNEGRKEVFYVRGPSPLHRQKKNCEGCRRKKEDNDVRRRRIREITLTSVGY